MSITKKRSYHSKLRESQSKETRSRILKASKMLFESMGYEKVTIDEIAKAAEVSAPSIYSIFQSKRGILLALIDEALSPEQFDSLVEKVKKTKCPRKKLEITAALSRQLYEAERSQFNLIQGASILDPVFKELEVERENRRYERQKETMESMAKEKVFKEGVSLTKARDILWTFTGRDLYRMLVVERGWSSGDYEKWLKDLLIQTLLPS